jgi:hypothetical protein
MARLTVTEREHWIRRLTQPLHTERRRRVAEATRKAPPEEQIQLEILSGTRRGDIHALIIDMTDEFEALIEEYRTLTDTHINDSPPRITDYALNREVDERRSQIIDKNANTQELDDAITQIEDSLMLVGTTSELKDTLDGLKQMVDKVMHE